MALINSINNIEDPQFKLEIRKFEKVNKKLINKRYSVIFNSICLNEMLFPIIIEH
mgnify:FL=1